MIPIRSALGIMNQMLLETRHKQAINKLEVEMKRELAQQKEELNQELERAMVQELEVRNNVLWHFFHLCGPRFKSHLDLS